jgi:hypothetical protein|tara:strand:+ start:25 stop:573 length:549 start_codon:yes stop_codon:yes gene_type:complete
MAIVDMKSTVAKDQNTMTGKINEAPKKLNAPNLSGMNKLFERKQPASAPMEEEAPMQDTTQMPTNDLIAKVQNLPDEDKAVLSAVLSPSVSNVLVQLAPELAPLVEAAGPKEENVIIPVSMFKSFATKRYSGDETQAVQSLITDMSGTEMGQSTVPPDTQMAEQSDDMMTDEISQIDSGELA